jgi:hypothetical protein
MPENPTAPGAGNNLDASQLLPHLKRDRNMKAEKHMCVTKKNDER